MIKENVKELAQLWMREAGGLEQDYAEARVQSSMGSGFMLKNGEPQPSMMGDSFGIGIRVLCGGTLAFSSTNVMERAAVRSLTSKTVKMAKASQRLVKKRVNSTTPGRSAGASGLPRRRGSRARTHPGSSQSS